ncbi:MAG: glucose-6-phosphate 1-dehydrogenase, partial [Parcubacteria group bacterium Greene0416_79]
EAARLDRLLGTLFSEEQIFRIDHYLAKETIQNVLSFRFSNGLFEPLWNRTHIERISLQMFEKEGVVARGAFYDGVGALRDVGQNHLLQMLALVAMENPRELSAARIRAARLKVLRTVSHGGQRLVERVVRGQYEGYRREPGVSPQSETETYFSLTVFVENARWKGVPFMLQSGKALAEQKVEISVFFKPAPCLCPERHEKPHQNMLTFGISPREEISALFWAKRPGFSFELEPKRLSFSFAEGALAREIPDAYERVLYDCLRGDQTLFVSTGEVRAEWRLITPILEKWSSLPLHSYAKGSAGPEAGNP